MHSRGINQVSLAFPRSLWGKTMRALPRAVRLYLGLSYLAAALLIAAQGWAVARALPAGLGEPVALVDIVIFTILAYVGEYTTLQVSPAVDQSLATPVHIAAILTLPAPVPLLTAAVAVAATQFVQRRTPLYKRAYNVARTALLVGLVTLLFAQVTRPTTVLRPGAILAAVPALALLVALYYALDVGLLVILLALLQRQSPRQVWRATYRQTLAPEAAATATGILVAAVWRYDHLLLALFIVPVWSVRLAFRAIARAEQAQRLADDRRQIAEQARVEAQVAREAAERALQVRDHFLISAAHNLRTPLTALHGRGDVIQARLAHAEPPPMDWLRRQVDAVCDATRRMVSTVEEITDVAEVQRGQTLTLRMGRVELGALAHAAAGLVIAASGTRRAADLHIDTPTSIAVDGDRGRLERVLSTILENALKYSEEGAPVRVTVRADTGQAIVMVTDHGIGIPADDLPRLVTPFYRASTARGVAGAGLGLAGATVIIAQHGGTLVVESVVGVGTTVTIRLPHVDSA